MSISAKELATRFPRLYHMAELGSWPSIREHGLLSTSRLLDIYGIRGGERESLEGAHRPESVCIEHTELGRAVVRDQKPMSEAGLESCLLDGLAPADWYRILNSKVFFWLTEERLEKLLGARAYRGKRHTVLTVDTMALLEKHAESVVLSPINSGATKPFARPRGHDTFLPLKDYPFEHRKRYGRNSVAELAVHHGVPDIADFVMRVENRGATDPTEVIWERDAPNSHAE